MTSSAPAPSSEPRVPIQPSELPQRFIDAAAAPVQVPDHQLIQRIGRGSYGEVWLAKNIVGTLRAIKILFRNQFTDPEPYEREFKGMQRFEPLSRAHDGFVDILQFERKDQKGDCQK